MKSKRDSFKRKIWKHYKKHGRVFPWRKTKNPYRILVSEFMLQQTQTKRVGVFYGSFLKKFPNITSLAEASLKDVLSAWQGLGYNRRAKHLHQLAKRVELEFGGEFPKNRDLLEELPGVGQSTSGAVLAFAHNIASPFIETNIRRVYIKEFFSKKEEVSDKEILEIIAETLDHKKPRKWYYALMDYGVFLKKEEENYNWKSASYKKQSSFKGSNRELRSKILRILLKKSTSLESLGAMLGETPKEKIAQALKGLEKDKMITRKGKMFSV